MTATDERARAEALMYACIERLGKCSPAALLVCDTYLAHDFFADYVAFCEDDCCASELWAWGSNWSGNLGLGDKSSRTTPAEVAALRGRRVRAVASGFQRSLAVAVADGGGGSLFAAGSGVHGACPELVRELSSKRVLAAACGSFHALVLLESGELLSWGNNEFGQLGLGDKESRSSPTQVAKLDGMKLSRIACGGSHSLALLETGDLFTWGCNFYGQLGVGADRSVPTRVDALAGRTVSFVACGDGHTAAVLENGDLFVWGCNGSHQLGIKDRENRFVPEQVKALSGQPVLMVACGSHHTMALLKSGEVYSFGGSYSGQLGIGIRTDCEVPRLVPFFEKLKVKSIHASQLHCAALLENGDVYTWGGNSSGQLGLGDKDDRTRPEKVVALEGKHVIRLSLGGDHSFALVR